MKTLNLDKRIKLLADRFVENKEHTPKWDYEESKKDYRQMLQQFCEALEVNTDKYLRYFDRQWERYKVR